MDKVFLGIDVGSVTTKFAAVDDEAALITSLYNRTAGNPIEAVQSGLREIQRLLPGRVLSSNSKRTGLVSASMNWANGQSLQNLLSASPVAALYLLNPI